MARWRIEEASEPKRRVFKWIIRLLIVLVLLPLGLLLGLLVGAIGVLSTETGGRWVASLVNDTAGPALSLADLRLDPAGGLTIAALEVRDADGPWLSVDKMVLGWSWTALLDRRFVAGVEVGTVRVARRPAPIKDGADRTVDGRDPAAIALPEPPIDIDVERLAIARIEIAEPVAGHAAVLTLTGRAAVERSGGASLDATAERIDGPAAKLVVTAAADLATRRLDVAIDAEEAAGGLVAAFAGKPDLPGVSLALDGDGDLDGWSGTLRATAGDAGIDGTVTLAGGTVWSAAFKGDARPGGFVDDGVRALSGEAIRLDLAASYSPDGAARVTRAGVETAVGTVGGSIALDPAGSLSGGLDIDLTPNDALLALAAPAELGPASFRLDLSGDLARPVVTLVGEVSRLATPEAALAPVPIDLEVKTTAPYGIIDVALSAVGVGLALKDPTLANLVGDRLDTVLGATINLDGGTARLDAIDVTAGPVALFGNGSAEFDGAAEAVLTIRHDALDRLATLTGMPVAGRAQAVILAALSPVDGLDLTVDATSSGVSAGPAEIAPLAGPSPSAFVQARIDPAFETVDLTTASVELSIARAEATGTIGLATRSIALDWSAAVERLDPLSELAKTKLAGRVAAQGALSGALDDPALVAGITAPEMTIDGRKVEDLRLDVVGRTIVSSPAASIDLGVTTERGPVTLRGNVRRAAAGFELDDLVLTRAGRDRVMADIVLNPDGPTAKGSVRVDIPDLGPIGDLLGQALAGRISGTIDLDAPRGDQRATLDIRLDGGRLGDEADRVSVAAVRVAGVASDLTKRPTVDLDITARGIGSGAGPDAAQVDEIAIAVAGGLDALGIGLAARGTATEVFDLRGQALLNLAGEAITVEARTLEAFWGPIDARLAAPAMATLAGGDIALTPLRLDLAGGTVEVSASKTADRVDADLVVTGLSVSRLVELVPDLDLGGNIALRASVRGSPAAPRVASRLEVRDLVGGGPELARLPPVAITAEAGIADGVASLVANADGFSNEPLTLRVSAPVRLALEPFDAGVGPDAPLSGRLDWSGRIETLMRYLPVDKALIAGLVETHFAIAGTVDHPDVSGSLTVTGGRYENTTTGTRLEPFALSLTGAGEVMQVAFDATAIGPETAGLLAVGTGAPPSDGTMSIAGTIDLAPEDGPGLDLRLEMRDAYVVVRDDVTAAVGADITVAGSPAGMTIAGRIEPSLVEVRLIDNLPPSVVELDVVDASAEPPEEDDTPDVAKAIALDILVDVPRRVFVRGRGLDSEWGGRLEIGGTAAEPILNGGIGPVRGTFTFAGKRFALQEGGVGFAPGSLDPTLNIAAVTKADDVTAIIRVRGSPKAPEITFESDPPLPDDEVLSRVLFGKSSGSLSAVESLQLAQALARLSSGEAGVLDVARQTLGLDELSFGVGDGGGIGTVRAGRYVAENVFVGVERGASSASTRATVEVDLTETIKVQSSAAADGRNTVGFEWELDY